MRAAALCLFFWLTISCADTRPAITASSEILLDDIWLPYGLTDADGHHYSVLSGGGRSIHIRDGAVFAETNRDSASWTLDLRRGRQTVATFTFHPMPLESGQTDCAAAAGAYLRAARALIGMTRMLALNDSHLARHEAANAGRLFLYRWALREGCPEAH